MSDDNIPAEPPPLEKSWADTVKQGLRDVGLTTKALFFTPLNKPTMIDFEKGTMYTPSDEEMAQYHERVAQAQKELFRRASKNDDTHQR